MKLSALKLRQKSIVFCVSVLLSSCNKKDEFFAIQEYVEGADAVCVAATDVNSCADIGTMCRPAYLSLGSEDADPVYLACIANPGHLESTDGSNSPADGSIPPLVTLPPGDAQNLPGTVSPTIEETIAADCNNLSGDYLWVKNIVRKEGTERQVKVKICHKTSNGSSHTIIIACPALKAHREHHEDAIGACVNP